MQLARQLVRPALLAVVPAVSMALMRTAAGAPPNGRATAWVWLVAVAALLLGRLARPTVDRSRLGLHPAAVVLPIALLIAGLLYSEFGARIMSVAQHYASFDRTQLAWLALAGFYGLLLAWLGALAEGLRRRGQASLELVFAVAAGVVPALHNQIETRYSTEPFLVVLEAAALVVFWLLLRVSFRLAWPDPSPPLSSPSSRARWAVSRRSVLALLGAMAVVAAVSSVHNYQARFSPDEIPEFGGITEDAPRYCGPHGDASPGYASCLVFSGADPPKYVGPFGPDRISLGSGTEAEEASVWLSLRSIDGWHRHRAANTLMVSAGGPLVVEGSVLDVSRWWPDSVARLRYTRIPRENLNGLQITKTGLASVLYQLGGLGGRWAQDPPFFAEVARFEVSPTVDLSTTVLEGWGGWRHRRSLLLFRDGIVAVLDDAQGPTDHFAAISWYVTGDVPGDRGRATLGAAVGDGGSVDREGPEAEVVFLPIDGAPITFAPAVLGEGPLGTRVQYEAPNGRRLRSATLFLLDDWIGADASTTDEAVTIGSGERQVVIRFADVFRDE